MWQTNVNENDVRYGSDIPEGVWSKHSWHMAKMKTNEDIDQQSKRLAVTLSTRHFWHERFSNFRPANWQQWLFSNSDM